MEIRKYAEHIKIVICKSIKCRFILLLFFIIGVSLNGIAQEHSLKIYANILRQDAEPFLFYNRNSGADFRGLSLVYKRINEKGISHEFETRFNASRKSLPNDEMSSFWEAQLRYERGGYWGTPIKKLFIQKGTAVGLYYLYENIDVETHSPYNVQYTSSGIDLSYFLHLEYHLTNNIYLDFNSSIITGNMGVIFTDVANPALTERQRRQGGYHFEIAFFGFIRLGVGYIFSPREEEGARVR